MSCYESEIINEKVESIEIDETASDNTSVFFETKSHSDLFNKIDIIIDNLSELSNYNLKDFELNKDFMNELSLKTKKINKLNLLLNNNINDFTTKEMLLYIKHKEYEKIKKSNKNKDKDKYAINKKISTFNEVLKFMDLENDTLISRAELLQKINFYIKNDKTSNNSDIFVEGDNKSFKLIGKVKDLFDFIKVEMKKRGDLEDESLFPEKLSYTQIMKYLKYCFPENKK